MRSRWGLRQGSKRILIRIWGVLALASVSFFAKPAEAMAVQTKACGNGVELRLSSP
jgi:hypothetical protein